MSCCYAGHIPEHNRLLRCFFFFERYLRGRTPDALFRKFLDPTTAGSTAASKPLVERLFRNNIASEFPQWLMARNIFAPQVLLSAALDATDFPGTVSTK